MEFPRHVPLEKDAIEALRLILGIMSDQAYVGDPIPNWDFEHIITLDLRLEDHDPAGPFWMSINDAELLLEGMAFTEIASEQFPWIDMVRWTTEFITTELRQHWSEEEWRRER